MSKLLEHGISPRPEWIIGCGASRVEGTRAITALLEQHPEVTAAVCYQDVVALGAILALRKLGRVIGQDFALVGFDDLPETALVDPPLTTVSVASRRSVKAGELLLERMAGNDEPAKSIILPPPWWCANPAVAPSRPPHALFQVACPAEVTIRGVPSSPASTRRPKPRTPNAP